MSKRSATPQSTDLPYPKKAKADDPEDEGMIVEYLKRISDVSLTRERLSIAVREAAEKQRLYLNDAKAKVDEGFKRSKELLQTGSMKDIRAFVFNPDHSPLDLGFFVPRKAWTKIYPEHVWICTHSRVDGYNGYSPPRIWLLSELMCDLGREEDLEELGSFLRQLGCLEPFDKVTISDVFHLYVRSWVVRAGRLGLLRDLVCNAIAPEGLLPYSKKNGAMCDQTYLQYLVAKEVNHPTLQALSERSVKFSDAPTKVPWRGKEYVFTAKDFIPKGSSKESKKTLLDLIAAVTAPA